MDFSKDSIISRYFSKKVFGGLDEFEVRDFLHVLAEEVRHLSQLTKDQNKKITDQEELIQDYRDREHILKQSISSAQEVANRIRKDAENQAQLILEKSQDKSSSLIQDARHSLQTVYRDIADLKRVHLQFKTNLKATLEAQLEMLEQGPAFSGLSHFQTEKIEDQSQPESPFEPEQNEQEQQNENNQPFSLTEPTQAESEQNNNTESEQEKSEQEKIENIVPPEAPSQLEALKESLRSLDKDFS